MLQFSDINSFFFFFKDLHKCNSVQADKMIFVIEMIAYEHMTLINK